MSVEENKELIRRYCEGDAKEIQSSLEHDEYHAPELVLHTPTGDLNFEQNHQFLRAEVSAFPDARYHCDDLVAEGDKVVARYRFTVTHSGPFLGIAATGKKVSVQGIAIYRIAGGRIVEGWAVSDTMGGMQQLGAISSASPQL